MALALTAQHECERIFHAVSAAGGRVKTGMIDASTRIQGSDFYGGCLAALGINPKIGRGGSGPYTGLLV